MAASCGTPAPRPEPRPTASAPLAVAVAAALTLLALAYGVTLRDRGLVVHDTAPVNPLRLLVDVNTAGADELAILPGLGPATARRIVAHRDAHGRFTAPEGLLDVPGIGPATLAGVRPHLLPLAPGEAAP